MPTVERRPLSERTVTLSSPNKKPPKWQSIVTELEGLPSGEMLVLTPDEGDTMRALKVQVARAAKSVGRQDDILYGENAVGKLEVWLRDKPKQKRGPRKPKEG